MALKTSSAMPWSDVRAALVRKHACADSDAFTMRAKKLSPFASSSETFMLECEYSNPDATPCKQRYFIKRSPHVVAEAKWLRCIRSRLNSTRLVNSVPEFVAVFESSNILITSFFDAAASFQTLLLKTAMIPCYRFTGRLGKVCQLSYRTGAWLAEFQAAVRRGEQIDLALEIPEMRERLAEIRILSQEEKEQIAVQTEKASQRTGPLPASLSHGDFAPRQILYNGTDISIIDWEMVHDRPRPCLHDVHYFLLMLSKRVSDLPATKPFIRTVADRFIAGYKANQSIQYDFEAAWPATRLVTLVTCLSRQHRAIQRQPGLSRLLRRRSFLARLASEIREQLHESKQRQ